MLTLCLLEQHSSPEWYPDRKGWRKGWSVAFISSERLGGSLFSKRVQYVMGGGQQPRRTATQSWTVGANVLFTSPIFSSACTSAIKKALSKNVCEHICVTTRLVATEVYDAILYSHQSLWLFYTFFHIPSPFSPLVLSDQGGQGWKKKPSRFRFVLYRFVLSLASLRIGMCGWGFPVPEILQFLPLLRFSQDPHPTPAESKQC